MSLPLACDISRKVVSVRYVQEGGSAREPRPLWKDDAAQMIEHIAAGTVGAIAMCLSPKAYQYFTNVPVAPGDYVLVRGGDYIHLGVVEANIEAGDVRSTRDVIAKIDFGPVLAARQAEKARNDTLKELEKRVKLVREKEDTMLLAKQYAEADPEIARLLETLNQK